MNDTRERLARDLAHAIRGWRDDDAGDLELPFHLLDAMREVAQEEDDAAKASIAVVIHDRCAALVRRIAALDLVLRRLLSENAHILVGGVAFSEQSLDELDRAQDHGRTEAAHGGSDGRPGAIPGRGAKWMVPPKQTATEVGESQDGGLSSVQPAPAPVDLTTQRAYMAHPVAPESRYLHVKGTPHNPPSVTTSASSAPKPSEEAVRLMSSLYAWHNSIGGKPLEVRSYLRIYNPCRSAEMLKELVPIYSVNRL